MKFRFLLYALSIFIISCTETATNTPTEKDYFYFETDSIKQAEVDHEIIIEKVDSLIRYQMPESDHKEMHQKFSKKYRFNDTFESKVISLNTNEFFIKNATVAVKSYIFPNNEFSERYIEKRLVKNYKRLYTEGAGFKKSTVSIYTISTKGVISKTPKYVFNSFGNHLEVVDQIEHYLSIIYGCCMSRNTYELYDKTGTFIISSNLPIESFMINKQMYFLGVLQNEYHNMPVLYIQNPDGNIQYIRFENLNLDNIDNYVFLLHDKKRAQIKTVFSTETSGFTQLELNSLDDLEIWLPFNKKDTLKIPFINNKAFGMKDAQLKVSLSENSN